MQQKFYLYITVLLLVCATTWAHAQNDLSLCWQQQAKPLENKCVSLCFKETRHSLYHSFTPWQQYKTESEGAVYMNTVQFAKLDSIHSGKKAYVSKTQMDRNKLLVLDYGDTALSPVSRQDFDAMLLENIRYIPAPLIAYFYHHKAVPDKHNPGLKQVSYTLRIDKSIVSLYIDGTDHLLSMITVLKDDDLYGDVLSTYSYSGYVQVNGLYIPQQISIEKINGKLKDEVHITAAHAEKRVPQLLTVPRHFTFTEKAEKAPEVTVERYDDHIYFLNLRHTDDKVMLVVFQDYIIVAEAPLSSANGELIINEAHKIAPGKPIRYFAFGHFHSHYTGGIRPFVHKGATVLCTGDDTSYIHYLAAAPHSLRPDSLYLQPRPLELALIRDSFSLAEGDFSIHIYHIGKTSAHTQDYLIYYFPKEKLLFEDDLAWISKDGAAHKANARQAGLYTAIKDMGLPVDTIIQSWPATAHDVKTAFSFKELEESVKK